MKRRTFLELTGLGFVGGVLSPRLALGADLFSTSSATNTADGAGYEYGSGYFGKWIRDNFGLPAYQYTCNQLTDPKAVSPVNKAWRLPTDHTHQIGNDRLVAAVSNFGHVQVRQDEGSPKFLNDYDPDQNRFGGGVGFLADGDFVLSTYYSGSSDSFDRVFGMGYLQKRVSGRHCEVDQIIFAPFGDDPVLVSQVTITNHSDHVRKPRWIEYWGCHNYQFSYRSLMEAAILGSADSTPQLRRELSERFKHNFQIVRNSAGLIDAQAFLGRSAEEDEKWQKVQASLKSNPNSYFGNPVPALAPRASMDDLNPPATFLVSLDAPADRYSTNASAFFKNGIAHPEGSNQPLNNDLLSTGPDSAFFLERDLELQPGQSKTIYFLYGYLPEGFAIDSLVAKYSAAPSRLLAQSCSRWKQNTLLFRVDAEPWVEREVAWSGYYLRSALTYDDFFKEHILSQGSGTQYVAGLQGAARDPLQHVLPFIFTEPEIVKQIIRYTMKEIQPDGAIPYGIVGCGVPMPCRYRPSDLELWLLWLTSEYVLATRDKGFLDETISVYPSPGSEPHPLTVRELLARTFNRVTKDIGVGKHDLMRLFNGDWNDSVVVNRFEPALVAEITKSGESVLNAAMACYVHDSYAELMEFTGQAKPAQEARDAAERQRQAVRKQWNGKWFRRAWLGEKLGWSGDQQLWLEPQPWAIIGGAADAEQRRILLASLNELVRTPSPIGALLQSQPDPTMKDEPGVGTNGGIFAAINGTLIWALAELDKSMAWDEWKKNTLARHAHMYPDAWFGIWSGPDAYHSIFAKNPGWTEPEAPVMNMHPHAWPLYSAAKLLGLEFHQHGFNLNLHLPLAQYEFASPLLGVKKSSTGYSGWYSPLVEGRWEIEITLAEAELSRMRSITVNGITTKLNSPARSIRFNGFSKPGSPLNWELI